MPIFLFSVLFGLSMDYQVFLLSRIHERWASTGDTPGAIVHGVASTARLITGAAAIIIVVFAGFATGQLVAFQEMGFGIAVALAIDATIVRLLLIPAAMRLLDERNWYLPHWLDWLPRVQIEGRTGRAGARRAGPAVHRRWPAGRDTTRGPRAPSGLEMSAVSERRDVVVVGGGQAGLAIGYLLAQQGRSFTILEAADAPAAAWRARWDSLRLFTPVRYDSLPGRAFPGHPDTTPAATTSSPTSPTTPASSSCRSSSTARSEPSGRATTATSSSSTTAPTKPTRW